MNTKLLPLFILFVAATPVFSQFSVNTGFHRHNDAFFLNEEAAGKPYTVYWMASAGTEYTRKMLRWRAGMTLLNYSRHIRQDYTYTSSSQSSSTTYGDFREADVQLCYIGFRFGTDALLWQSEKFTFAIGLSQHIDVLARKSVKNVYQTTWTSTPEYTYWLDVNGEMVQVHGGGTSAKVRKEGDFEVLYAAEQYWYPSIELKPSWHFGRVSLELQCLFNFTAKPRVLNWMYGNFYTTSNSPYYATSIGRLSKNDKEYSQTEEMGKGDLYISNEIGLSLKYRLGEITGK